MPDAVWQRFLEDTEADIRDTAPREPSARERTHLASGEACAAESVTRQPTADRPPLEAHQEGWQAVGEVWLPQEPRSSQAWRDMDGGARHRRVGLILATVAAGAALLGALSYLPPSDDNGAYRHSDTTSQQSEEGSGAVPTAAADSSVMGSPSSPR